MYSRFCLLAAIIPVHNHGFVEKRAKSVGMGPHDQDKRNPCSAKETGQGFAVRGYA